MREELKERLLNTALRSATQKGANLTPIARTDLTTFINQGVDRMTSTEYASEVYRQLAENNVLRLIDAMSLDSKSRNINESLDYTAFSNSAKSICPLWPFC